MKKKKIILPIVMLLLLIIATVGVTFAAFTFTKEGTVENIVESSTIMLTYTEGKTGIILNEAYPVSDETGKVLTGANNVFDFTVQATLGKSNVISYEVSAVKIPITDMTPLENNEVKLYLERAIDPDTTYQEVLAPSNFLPIENQTEVGSPIGSMILDSGIFMEEGTTIHNYRLRLWVDENTQIPNGESRKYGVKVNVYAKQLMIPNESCFTFDSSTGTITDYSDACSKDVVIPNMIGGVKVMTIGTRAFFGKNLVNVIIPDSITTIGKQAFSLNQLTNVTIGKGITSIENTVFASNKLTNITIPSNVTTIGASAFSSNRLVNITIPNSVTSIGSLAFDHNQLTSVVIPDSVTSIGPSAFIANQLPDNQAFIYNRNADGSINYSSLNSYGGAKTNDVVIPNNIKYIEREAFFDSQLTSVIIPNSVINIGYQAFIRNKLINVVIPDSVTSIEDAAFYDNQLTSVTIGRSVTSIGKSAFAKIDNSNRNLTQIINLTGRSFNWYYYVNGNSSPDFITGTISHSLGDIIVTDN